MTLWFHSTILATSLAATVAVGLASAAIYQDASVNLAEKGDRLAVSAEAETAYVTIETRKAGVSVLNRVPVAAPTELN
jgi:hypothetical protein